MTNEAPFLVENGSMADYHEKWEWLSKSVIDKILTTPRHFWYKFLNPEAIQEKNTKPQSLGTDIHTLLLEFQRFNELYVRGPEGKNRIHKAYKDFAEEHPGKIVLPFAEYELLEAIYKSVYSQKIGRYLLSQESQAEVSCYWVDTDLDQKFKCRPDLLIESKRIVVDLKTTAIIGKYKFQKHASDLNYHRSAALTLRGLKALTGEEYRYVFLVVETKPPFNVAAYSYEQDDIDIGNAEIDKAVSIYQQCQREDKWPGYPEAIQSITLPDWRKRNG